MTELKPTLKHLNDPYVLQLLQVISEQDDIIEAYRAFIESLDTTPHDWLRDKIKELPER